MPTLEQQLNDLFSQRLNRENLGIPQEVMQQQKQQLQGDLDKQLANNVQNRFNNLNKRGILDSSITAQSMNQANQNYADSLTKGMNQLNWQNEQMKSNQLQNALSQAMNWDQNQWQRGFQEDKFDLDRQLAEQQRKANQTGPMDVLLGLGGAMLGGPAGGALGSWIGSQF